MECECGALLNKVVQATADQLYFCSKCTKVWRLEYKDPVSGDAVLVDYEGELEEKESGKG